MLFVYNSSSERQNSEPSDAELSALCTQGPALSSCDRDEKILLEPLPRPQLLSSTHKERSNRFANPKNKSKSKSSKCEDSAALNSCCVQRASRSGSAEAF